MSDDDQVFTVKQSRQMGPVQTYSETVVVSGPDGRLVTVEFNPWWGWSVKVEGIDRVNVGPVNRMRGIFDEVES